MKFKEFDWEKIASHIGGTIRRKTSSEVEIAAGRGIAYRIQDLRGELVISEIKPIGRHVTYDDPLASDATLARRIIQAIAGKAIDYTLELGEAREEGGDEDE